MLLWEKTGIADSEMKQQRADTTPSSPASQADTASGSRSSKDRRCPFCSQAFTSSSLGRHLDLYIKPRNPKPADGVHHVDEIKKMRSGITRRQAKTSLKTGANVDASGWRHQSVESTPASASGTRQTAATEARMVDESPVRSPVNMKENEALRTSINTANWQATGVINNLPPRASSRDHAPTGQAQRIHEMRHDAAGNKTPRPESDNENWQLHEDAEVGRAAELALREVLSSIEAAKRKVDSRQFLEDLDFFSLAFPGLILAILPAPGTLFSPCPFPSGDSWTLTPPGQRQFETLNRLINIRMREMQQQDPEFHNETFWFKHAAHADGAYEHWNLMSEAEQAGAWTLEVMRSCVTAQERSKQAKVELEAAQTRIRHLEAEYDRLSRCQLPREYLLHPPNTMPVPATVARELSSFQHRTAASEVAYDADALLSKWRSTIRFNHRRSQASAPQTQQKEDRPAGAPTTRNLTSDFVINGSVFGVNGAMPLNPDIYHTARHGAKEAVAYDYETPPEPGAIVEDTDGGDGEVDAQGEDSREEYALVRQSVRKGRGVDGGGVNANGKRGFVTALEEGRKGMPRVYKEQCRDRGNRA
ncbi:hypothetical protein LTR62_003567 [Meristemomyces frigidus]|uniref:Uncharacterized protein n=1 Tax=Meristemomyces frigidus TaxID=1508187 RepID=A0AAN7TK46_9PEZI|nr:hypothetical protein LTR62_003567 [Meristemomyces frigidus]